MLRRTLTLTGLTLAVVALATGCAGAKTTGSAIPESASLAPADALAFVTVTTDDGADQWQNAESLVERIPGLRDGLTSSITGALGEEGLDWEEDVAPALGPEVVIVATAQKEPIVLVRPESEEKLDALVANGNAPVVRAAVEDWQALAQSQAALDAYRAALAKGTLEDVPAFMDGLSALPDESLGRAWVDVSRLAEDIGQLVEQAGTELDLGLEWLSAALSAEEDGLLLTMGVRVPGGGDSSYEPELLRRVPSDAVAVVSFGGTQAVLDRVQSGVDVDEVSQRLEKLTGISLEGALDALTGEGLVYVRPSGGQIPEVALVLSPPDPDEAWETLNRLARTLADDAGATVSAGTEAGVETRRLTVDELTVTYARIDDDTLIVTTGADAVARFTGDGDKLVDAEAFTRAAETVGLEERTKGLVYVDLDGLVPLVEDVAGESVPPEASDVLESLDAVILEASGDGDTTSVSGFLRLDD
jgi:hypothetical protein